MKKKLVLILAVLVVAVMIFTGCTSDRYYIRNLTSFDQLHSAMGDKLAYPEFELKGENKFFNPADFKDVVTTIPESDRNNEIRLLYVPEITLAEGAELEKDANKDKYDAKAYRYTIKLTLNKAYGAEFDKGDVKLYIVASDYSKVEKLPSTKNVKLKSVADFRKEKENNNKKDEKISKETRENEADNIYKSNVYVYENTNDREMIRYFVVGDNIEYRLTAQYTFAEKATDAEKTALVNKTRETLDAILKSMVGLK